MKIIETYIVRELKHPYTLRKVHVAKKNNGGSNYYFMELGQGLWELTKEEFHELIKKMK